MSVRLYMGDCADVLATLTARSFDMAYIDPPFGNKQQWSGARGSFSDKHSTSRESDMGWQLLKNNCAWCADALAISAPDENGHAYLGIMARILFSVRRVLKLTATLWLHFDDTFGAHLRILCDGIFGAPSALGTIVWKRTSSHNSTKGYGRCHDTIAVYGRSRAAQWKLWRVGEVSGDPCDPDNPVRFGGIIEGINLASYSRERAGYPTQKPVELIERFISAATLKGDCVLDATCGSGTTGVAAVKLGRNFVGIDISADAIALTEQRISGRSMSLPTGADWRGVGHCIHQGTQRWTNAYAANSAGRFWSVCADHYNLEAALMAHRSEARWPMPEDTHLRKPRMRQLEKSQLAFQLREASKEQPPEHAHAPEHLVRASREYQERTGRLV